MQISSWCLQSTTVHLTESAARGGPERDLKHPIRGQLMSLLCPEMNSKSDKTPTKHHLFHSHFAGRWTFGGVGWSQFLKECHHFEGNIIYVGAKEISYWERWLKDTVHVLLICHEHFKCLMYRNKHF